MERDWPQQMFMLRTENLRPYLRFEQKFNQMFEDAYEEFDNFKKSHLDL